jgi:hypothetical protein
MGSGETRDKIQPELKLNCEAAELFYAFIVAKSRMYLVSE